tara:strand:- start:227 stop:1174 length:948 start_codon:yes stop_codon:yes gene_type:complete
MNILYFDVEHGSQTLGSKEAIQKHFNLPMLTPSSWDEFQGTIGKLYQSSKVKEKIELSKGFEIEQVKNVITPRKGLTVDTLVIDTFSELSKKFMRTLTDKSGKMKLQEWGRLKNKLDTCLEFVTRIPGNVICTCHSRTQTMDSGENKLMPYIDGSTKEDISKWFDFVFYTKTITDPDGKRKYVWVTNRTEMYDHAKDRTQMLPAEMEQDFSQVLSAAHVKGFNGSKILIIGSPGSGKTYSLKTLVNADVPEPEEEYDPNTEAETAQGESEDIQETIRAAVNEAETNGEIPVEQQVSYLRGETNNIEGGSNANTNS